MTDEHYKEMPRLTKAFDDVLSEQVRIIDAAMIQLTCRICPYDDGPVDIYAAHHTHPHPSISPDGRRVVYTSDSEHSAQLYELTANAASV